MSDYYYGSDENDWNDGCDFFNEEVVLKKRSEEEKGKVFDLDQYLESSEPIYDDDGDIDWLLPQEEEIDISSPTRFVSNERVPESTTQQEAQLGSYGSADWESQVNFTMQYPDGNSYSGDCYLAPSRDVYDVSLWEEKEILISSPTRFVSNDRVSEPIAQQKEFEHYEKSRKQQEYAVQQYPVGCQGSAAWERLDNFTMQYQDGNSYWGDSYPAPIYDVQCVQVQNQDYPVPSIPTAENLYSENREPAPNHDHLDLPIAPCPSQPLAPLKQPRFILVSPKSRRRLQAVRKSRSLYTIPLRTTQKRARRNLPPVTESTVEVTIWRNENGKMQKELPVRPPFSYRTLANLVCLNSPSRSVSLQEAYSFVLHHFPYYRFIEQNSWKSTLRKIMCRGELFVRVFKDDSREVLYEMKNKNVDGVGYTDYEMEWINQDRRDIDFFRRMQRGQLGLPRQLFYSVIGLGCPKLAGPENSALFYHLWSLGHRFDNITNLFKSHKTEFTGEEPVFDEERVFLNLTNNHRIHVDKKWGYGVNMEDGLEWSERDSALFFKNILWYFNEQKEMKRRNLPNWATPSLVRENIPRDQNVDLNTVNM
ncbi:hypothetical protein GCK72_012111 [Caenorhabditis remanei]|uniref:Fork-head domain-containing protein n=1 Tax=Caenorhabditis remanei TaxID=31234 RepID=A0A6A5GLZ5_CAERE|nr:hypothetical protein GCK72_012111 [Caenorhabditis remanei]KAF1755661.1 hypothetical protein GCK72_012111 [Caenorhabditis remanei]